MSEAKTPRIAAPAAPTPAKSTVYKNPLIGMFGHILKNGLANNQLEIMAEVSPGYFLAMYYEAGFGNPSNYQVFPIAEIAKWNLYKDRDQWIERFERDSAIIRQNLEKKFR